MMGPGDFTANRIFSGGIPVLSGVESGGQLVWEAGAGVQEDSCWIHGYHSSSSLITWSLSWEEC